MNSAADERAHLVALLGALADPARAAALPTDDPTLVAVARHHRLTPLLSITRGVVLPPTLAEAWRRDRLVTAARNLMLAQAAETCLAALARAGAPAIVLKGLAYEANLYHASGARPTADVDLLVRDADRRGAFAVLDGLGFEPRAAAPGFDDADYHEVAWTRAGVEVDLHMGLAPTARCRIDYDAIWASAEPLAIGAAPAQALTAIHAAIFQALHMAIDHFAVPAIYLIDLARLLPTAESRREADALAGAWRCRRPLRTALALAAAFLPELLPDPAIEARQPRSPIAARIIAAYGGTAPLPRPEQLLRKLAHFDALGDAFRYVVVQSRRNAREQLERRVRHRSARARLGLPSRPRSSQ